MATPEPTGLLNLAVELLILIMHDLDSFADLRALQIAHPLFYHILQPTVRRERILLSIAKQKFAPNWEDAHGLLQEQKKQNLAYTTLGDEESEPASPEIAQDGRSDRKGLSFADVRQLLSNARYIKRQEPRLVAYKKERRCKGSPSPPEDDLTSTERNRFHRALYRYWFFQLQCQGDPFKPHKYMNVICSPLLARLSITEFTEFARASEYLSPWFQLNRFKESTIRGFPRKIRIYNVTMLERKIIRKIKDAAGGNSEIEIQLRHNQLEYKMIAMLDEGVGVAAKIEGLVKEGEKGREPTELRKVEVMVFRPSILRRRL